MLGIENFSFIKLLILIGIGFCSGFLNVLAAGGSMFTVPFLIFLGLPAGIANATNRLALLLNSSVAVAMFKKKKILDIKTDKNLILPVLLGTSIGAIFAVDVNEQILELIIGCLLVVMFFLFLFQPEKWMRPKENKVSYQHPAVRFIIFFFIGLYSGFIQMGAGFFMLANFVFTSHLSLVRANALKTLLVFICTIVACSIFIYNDLINWKIGLILALGNMTGAYFGSLFSMKEGGKWIRYFVLIALVTVAIKMFWGFHLYSLIPRNLY